MKKIAIISSFSESCGNAYFTKVLIESMEKEGVQVDCLSLNLLLTQSTNSEIRAKADIHINDICKKLKEYDGVNIQFEAGLYGTLPGDIVRRTIKLVNANKATSVTLHSPRLINDSASEREIIKNALKFRLIKATKMYFHNLRANVSNKINNKIIKYLAKNKINIIAHTLRAKEQIELLYDYTNVSVHPLKFIDADETIDNSLIANIKEQYALSPATKIIGVFGFINEYKGHTLAIDALSKMPENYKLMFFGRQHPQTIKNNELVNKYIATLQHKITDSDLEDRVFFMGEFSNEDFKNLAGSVDLVWLPYVENGQDGSGIASICLEVANKVLCSSSLAFDELFKLVPSYHNYARFDIGNYLELANKSQNFIPAKNNIESPEPSLFSLSSQARLYIQLSGGSN